MLKDPRLLLLPPGEALLRKSAGGRTALFPGQTYSRTFVTGMPQRGFDIQQGHTNPELRNPAIDVAHHKALTQEFDAVPWCARPGLPFLSFTAWRFYGAGSPHGPPVRPLSCMLSCTAGQWMASWHLRVSPCT